MLDKLKIAVKCDTLEQKKEVAEWIGLTPSGAFKYDRDLDYVVAHDNRGVWLVQTPDGQFEHCIPMSYAEWRSRKDVGRWIRITNANTGYWYKVGEEYQIDEPKHVDDTHWRVVGKDKNLNGIGKENTVFIDGPTTSPKKIIRYERERQGGGQKFVAVPNPYVPGGVIHNWKFGDAVLKETDLLDLGFTPVYEPTFELITIGTPAREFKIEDKKLFTKGCNGEWQGCSAELNEAIKIFDSYKEIQAISSSGGITVTRKEHELILSKLK